jgi:hypothetical protein
MIRGVVMDLIKKFNLIEQEARNSLKPAVITELKSEVVELVNWRKSFKFNSAWLKESILVAFDEQFKNRRRQFILDGIVEADMSQLYLFKDNITRCLSRSAPIVNSFQAKTFIVLSKEQDRFYFSLYKTIPDTKKAHSEDRLSRAKHEFVNSMTEQKMNYEFIDKLISEKNGDSFYLTGVRVDITAKPLEDKKIPLNKKSAFDEKIQEL